ncbi:MAG TPA: SDR family oxidoreductase [Methylomirabilota bacterium]|nr:SDR family oxidoreductase [Methylomirabilota bacterium]
MDAAGLISSAGCGMLADTMMDRWALITGASAGIGHELARLFAADRFNLVLNARNEARLNALATELAAAHHIQTRVVARDLGEPGRAQELFDAVNDLPISTLVNNAGFGAHDAFNKTEISRLLEMMRLNVEALVHLTRLFLPQMLEHRDGRIMNVGSTAGFQPGPFMAVYYATKAFVNSFSLALAEEISGTGVSVTTFCPGPTSTEFQERAGMKRSMRWLKMMTAAEAAHIGYRGLMKGKRLVIPGVLNRVTSTVSRCSPLGLSTRIARRINEGS